MNLAENYIVEKSNVLNEVRRNNLSLQELRFFSIYLSKINSRDENTRKVTFPLEDFRKIMELGRLNNNHIKSCFEHLLQQIVTVPNSDGTKGFSSFQIFKKCKLYQDDLLQWQVEIDAHDEALPLMFDIKYYVKYELWNALSLSSSNQLRMYEILKQYEKKGKRTLDLVSLKELLGFNNNEYPRWVDFRKRVLDSCQQALAENTDICFTYEPIKVGRKFTGVNFFIVKNQNYTDKLSLDEFINLKNINGDNDIDDHIEFLRDACCLPGKNEPEFTREEMHQIFEILVVIPENKFPSYVPTGDISFQQYHFLAYQYANLNRQDKNNKIKNRFAYFMKILKSEAEID